MLRKLLLSVKSSKAPGLDEIPAFVDFEETQYSMKTSFTIPFTKLSNGNKPAAFSTSYIYEIHFEKQVIWDAMTATRESH